MTSDKIADALFVAKNDKWKGRYPKPKSVPVPPGPDKEPPEYKNMIGKAADAVDQVIGFINQANDLYPRGAKEWDRIIRRLEKLRDEIRED